MIIFSYIVYYFNNILGVPHTIHFVLNSQILPLLGQYFSDLCYDLDSDFIILSLKLEFCFPHALAAIMPNLLLTFTITSIQYCIKIQLSQSFQMALQHHFRPVSLEHVTHSLYVKKTAASTGGTSRKLYKTNHCRLTSLSLNITDSSCRVHVVYILKPVNNILPPAKFKQHVQRKICALFKEGKEINILISKSTR